MTNGLPSGDSNPLSHGLYYYLDHECQLIKHFFISISISGYSSDKLVCGKSFEIAQQIICGENCSFVIHSNGAVSACGEGSNGRLGLGNSDDYDTLTIISALRGMFMLTPFE